MDTPSDADSEGKHLSMDPRIKHLGGSRTGSEAKSATGETEIYSEV
jgi:hypothetical protein